MTPEEREQLVELVAEASMAQHLATSALGRVRAWMEYHSPTEAPEAPVTAVEAPPPSPGPTSPLRERIMRGEAVTFSDDEDEDDGPDVAVMDG